MPLPNTATYEEVLEELQELTGINQKSELIAAVEAKGGVVPAEPSMWDIVNGIMGIPQVKKAEGTGLRASADGYVEFYGLDFAPKLVIVETQSGAIQRMVYAEGFSAQLNRIRYDGLSAQNQQPWAIFSNGFRVYFQVSSSLDVRWVAYG